MFTTKELINTFNSPLNLIILLVMSFLLGLAIASVYKKNSKSASYSQSFVNTLVLLLPVVALIISFVSNNVARAIGVFGAFSIVRFRTAVKEAKDMFYIFWILATGLVMGAGDFGAGITATVIISIMVFILNKFNFGRFSDYEYLVVYLLDTSKADISKISKKLTNLVKEQEILNVQSAKDGKEIEITTSVSLKKDVQIDTLIETLKKEKAIKSLSVNPAKFDLEY
jgi:uncharacterized membrane protein YhiD involved in acid resistance